MRTVERIRADLGSGPFIYRYHYDDGVGGPEGAFVLCGFWLAEVLALMGRVDEAQDVFTAHLQASNHVGLLAEQIDPRSLAQLGNFPQAFSHVGLINAAAAIDQADGVLPRHGVGSPIPCRNPRRDVVAVSDTTSAPECAGEPPASPSSLRPILRKPTQRRDEDRTTQHGTRLTAAGHSDSSGQPDAEPTHGVDASR